MPCGVLVFSMMMLKCSKSSDTRASDLVGSHRSLGLLCEEGALCERRVGFIDDDDVHY